MFHVKHSKSGVSSDGELRLYFAPADLLCRGRAAVGRAAIVTGETQVANVLCVANQKGGVGKTTTALNLAVAMAKADCQTLLVDLDPQCNATSGLGQQPTAHHCLVQRTPLRDSLRNTGVPNLLLLPGCRSFQDVTHLAQSADETSMLEQHLAHGFGAFDYVLIDCPPSLGQLTQAALLTSTEVLMPIQCEYFAMEGLTQMIHVIRKIMQTRPGRLEFGGILLTMYKDALELTLEVDTEVREFFGEIVFDTVIPWDIAVSEAPSHGKSVIDYAPRSRGARAYIELCMEVLERE